MTQANIPPLVADDGTILRNGSEAAEPIPVIDNGHVISESGNTELDYSAHPIDEKGRITIQGTATTITSDGRTVYQSLDILSGKVVDLDNFKENADYYMTFEADQLEDSATNSR